MLSFSLTGRFFEAPRWHQGRWYVSDMSGHTVYSLSPAGDARIELELDDRPSGLGWMPDGALIVVGMEQRVLWRRAPGATSANVFADLAPLCVGVEGHLNEMVVSADGHAYVGFDPDFTRYGFQSELGGILRVNRHGAAETAARSLQFPNGMVVSRGGDALIVAETGRPMLTRFPIGPDGGLGEPTVWARVDAAADQRSRRMPALAQDIGLDGCALDAEGHIWVANANSPSCLRIAPGGDIVDAVFIPNGYRCLACALGGEDGKTLLLCGLDLGAAGDLSTSVSHLFHCDVSVPAA